MLLIVILKFEGVMIIQVCGIGVVSLFMVECIYDYKLWVIVCWDGDIIVMSFWVMLG